MEVRKITKNDGTRLFAEIPAKIVSGGGLLPDLKKGDFSLVSVKRTFTDEDMQKLVGKYIRFYELEEDFFMDFEGEVQLNKKELWDEDDEVEEGKYVLMDYDEEDDFFPTMAFDDLNDVYDVEVLDKNLKELKKDPCVNQKCKKPIPRKYRWCPHCRTRNKNYNKEV